MGKRIRRKGEVGKAAAYISRNQALRRLQLSLADFRKLCIYKGIYPRSNNSVPRFHKKDILFLSHDSLINTLRQVHTYKKRMKKAIASRNPATVRKASIQEPHIRLDSIIKERYPTFDAALYDLDDALSTVFAYAYLTSVRKISVIFHTHFLLLIGIQKDLITQCRRLSIYFLHYVIMSQTLQKVFISVKGFYFQAVIEGQSVVWVIPHNLMIDIPTDVDFKVMNTFAHLHVTLLGFINYKLYHSLGVEYPPKVASDDEKLLQNNNEKDLDEEANFDLLATLNVKLMGENPAIHSTTVSAETMVDDFSEFSAQNELERMKQAQQQEENFKKLFLGLKFYLSRETPREVLVFIVRCFGGKVVWDDPCSSKTLESDPTITHHIIDRPSIQGNHYANRTYVQPQWLFDCVNERKLVATAEYAPGHELPPHLSPFDNQIRESYETATSLGLKEEDLDSDKEEHVEERMKQPSKKAEPKSTEELQFEAERRKLAIKSMPKKRKRLYDQIKKSRKFQLAGVKRAILNKQKLEKLATKSH